MATELTPEEKAAADKAAADQIAAAARADAVKWAKKKFHELATEHNRLIASGDINAAQAFHAKYVANY
jgi:hypothetical protein